MTEIERKIDAIIELINMIVIRKTKRGSRGKSSTNELGEKATSEKNKTAKEKRTDATKMRYKLHVKIEFVKSNDSAENDSSDPNENKFAKRLNATRSGQCRPAV